MILCYMCSSFFFFNDTATTEIYTLSLHDALPISSVSASSRVHRWQNQSGMNPKTPKEQSISRHQTGMPRRDRGDRKSTRLNSSHDQISYAVFCLKKKKKNERTNRTM